MSSLNCSIAAGERVVLVGGDGEIERRGDLLLGTAVGHL